MRRLLGVGLAAVALADPAAAALPRSATDRPDEVAGPQIHAVYALPSDGQDRNLDAGLIENSVALFRGWLAGETGGPTLRVDTFGGSLDVTYVRLGKSDAEIASRGAFVRDEVEAGIRAAGLNAPGKIYAVWYEGSSTYSCGGAFWPPAIFGNAIVMYLRGRPPGSIPCDSTGLAPPGAPPGYWEFAMLHDIFHGLGAVPTCAPHHHLSGHTSDSPNDLMWSGNAPWQLPPRLDIGRDDYYGHGRADCADLMRSPYLAPSTAEPEPAPQPEVRVTGWTWTTPRAGRVVRARMLLALDGAPAATGTTRCSARIGRRTLRVVSRTFAEGAATCRWQVPRGTRRKRVTGTLTATVNEQIVRRTFTAVVR